MITNDMEVEMLDMMGDVDSIMEELMAEDDEARRDGFRDHSINSIESYIRA